MSIVSNYIWEGAVDGGMNPVSLVLQQVKVRGREIGLFCISSCSQEPAQSGILTEWLVEWFHRSCLPACEGRRLPQPDALLERELTGRQSYGGILLIGSRFYLFGQGEISIQLVNYRYNRPRLKPLTMPLSGRIQKGVGLLLHNGELTKNLLPEEINEILHGEGVWQEQRIGKRLRELYLEGRSRGNTGPVGGIYLQIL